MKKLKLLKEEDLINWWLKKYHNTDLDQVKKEHPEWAENPSKHSRDFYSSYMVNEEQHDEWEEWAKEYTRKVTGLPKSYINRGWWTVYLNTSPQIMETKKENNDTRK